MNEHNNQEEQKQQYIGDPNLTDQQRIQLNIDEFYNTLKTFENTPEKTQQIRIMRNNIINQNKDTRKFRIGNDSISLNYH